MYRCEGSLLLWWGNINYEWGRGMGQSVSRRYVTAELRVRGQIVPHAICGGQSGTGVGYSQSTSAFPCQYHSTNASYSLIHLSPMLYNHNQTQTQLQVPENKFPREIFGCLYEVNDAFRVLHNIPIHEL